MPRSAKLIWRPHTNINVKSYQIERSSVENPEYKVVKKIDGRLNAEYIDSDLKDSSSYTYRIRVITYEDIVSKPSEAITIVTKPLPVPVIRVQATNNIPDAIVISWSKNPETDLDYYKIYRASSPTGSYKYHVKTKDTSYTDAINGSAQIKYYKITSVDKDGLESLMSDVPAQGSTVEAPETPTIVSANASNNQVSITFKPTDRRTVSYLIIKTTQTGILTKSSEEITNITSTKFVDHNIQPNTKYSYEIMSIDTNGMKSKPTNTIEFDIKAQ
jgi:fibronectin type 3 domain-containing protein